MSFNNAIYEWSSLCIEPKEGHPLCDAFACDNSVASNRKVGGGLRLLATASDCLRLLATKLSQAIAKWGPYLTGKELEHKFKTNS